MLKLNISGGHFFLEVVSMVFFYTSSRLEIIRLYSVSSCSTFLMNVSCNEYDKSMQ